MQRKTFTGPELAVLRLAVADYIYTLVNHPGEQQEAFSLFKKLAPSSKDEVVDLEPESPLVYRMKCANKLIYGRDE